MDTILISYDNRDEEIATKLKAFLENIFLNAEVYVAGRNLQGGNIWIEDIRNALKSSKAIITLLTRMSINNKWVYFESGAGFTEDKTIPLIVDNLEISDIPAPLNLIQARFFTETGLQQLIDDTAKKLNVRKPIINNNIKQLIKDIEEYFQLRRIQQLYELIPLKVYAPNAKKQWTYNKTCLVHDFIIDNKYQIAVDTYIFPHKYVIELFGRNNESADYLFDIMCKKDDFLPQLLSQYERHTRLVYKTLPASSNIEAVAEIIRDLLQRIEKYDADLLL